MKIGLLGLGRMGGNMVWRPVQGGHEVVGDSEDATAAARFSSYAAAGWSPATDARLERDGRSWRSA